jgi:NADH dehydrogenase
MMKNKIKIVIIGAGFGGLNAAKAFRKSDVSVTIIDQYNYHLFQPLLYQVATAGLSPADISVPIRQVVSKQKNCNVLMATVQDIDLKNKNVITGSQKIPFDYLIVATGAKHSYFGNDDWQQFAPGLKNLDDATEIRRKILQSFEQAEITNDEEKRQQLMTFCVIGGGPTGVELAGAIAELAKKTLAKDFRNIDPSTARIILLEAGGLILNAFPEKLSIKASKQLAKLGVEVKTKHLVNDCNDQGVLFDNYPAIHSKNIIWAAGVKASSAHQWLGVTGDRAGRVPVNGDLSLPDSTCVYVIGDTALNIDKQGNPVPGVAPAAKQMGKYVANLIVNKIHNKPKPADFKYKDYGNLATIGRKAAVADFGKFTLCGFPAWFMWSFAHVMFLIGFRNRLSVMMNWAWHYFSFSRGARLITGKKKK